MRIAATLVFACLLTWNAFPVRDRDISGPFDHDNLRIFLLRGAAAAGAQEYSTLEEAMAAGTLRIGERTEGATVGQLEVENTGHRPVFLQAGDTLKGGKQDRTIGTDTIVPPRSGRQPLTAFCVEPQRWALKTLTAAEADFRSNDGRGNLATLEQRLALKLDRNQSSVWKYNAYGNQALSRECGNLVNDSFAMNVDDPLVQARVKAYVDALVGAPAGRDDVVGMAFAINGRINSADVYASPGLFRKMWPKLLRTCALEAIIKRSGPHSTTAATDAHVRTLLAEAAKGTERDRLASGETECRTRSQGKYVQFETRFRGVAGHIGFSMMD